MKEGTLRTRDGAKLWYEVHSENKSGVPLIMVMGMSGIAHDFYPLVQSIARQRKVIIFDHRGIGQSAFPDTEEWEGDLTIDDMAFDVIDILKHLKVQEADLLGWSMGGMIAQALVSHESGKNLQDGRRQINGVTIRSLVLTATMTKLPHGDFSPSEIAQNSGAIKDKKERNDYIVREMMKMQYFPEWFEQSQRNRDILEQRIKDSIGSTRPQQTIGMQVAAISGCDTRKALKEQVSRQLPVLLIQGKRDRMISFTETKYIEESLPQLQWFKHPEIGLEFGHFWFDFGSKTEIWADAIGKFLDTGKVKL